MIFYFISQPISIYYENKKSSGITPTSPMQIVEVGLMKIILAQIKIRIMTYISLHKELGYSYRFYD